jgi:transposase
VVATERDERARDSFRERLRGVDPERLRFVDESSTNVALTPRYGGAPKGERVRGKAPRNWGKNVTLISSISLQGMGPSMSIEGPSDTDSFGLYMREILAPTLKAGQIVLMDNLSVHKSKWVRVLIEQRGCQLWLLPPYSPDFNPIEEAFSKVKAMLRRAQARALETLFEATEEALGRSALKTHAATSGIADIRCHRRTRYEKRSSRSNRTTLPQAAVWSSVLALRF